MSYPGSPLPDPDRNRDPWEDLPLFLVVLLFLALAVRELFSR